MCVRPGHQSEGERARGGVFVRVIRPLSSCPKTAMVCQVNKNKLIVYAGERESEREKENEKERREENEREKEGEKHNVTTTPRCRERVSE